LTHLYLIRHGEAVCNVDPTAPAAGPNGDLGLTAKGRIQAERLRDRLAATAEIPAGVLIASTLRRARETAEILAPALGLPIIWDDEVQELHIGELDGTPWNEIEHLIPDLRDEPLRPIGPGGENWPQFILRVGRALERIVHAHEGKTIVIICHGGVIDASFLLFSGMAGFTKPALELHTRNTSITHWELRKQSPSFSTQESATAAPLRWTLHRYGDDLHVRDIGAPERIRWTRVNQTGGGAEQLAVPLPTEE